MLRDYTGTPLDTGPRAGAIIPAPARPAGGRGHRARAKRPPRLRVEVVWGDITKAEGDVYAVGHYEGVLPQRAERALDEAVSGPSKRRPLIITDQTRRGILRGGLGDVAFFPWGRRVVAVAGMGHAGTFGEPELRRLARNLTWAVAGLPAVRGKPHQIIAPAKGDRERLYRARLLHFTGKGAQAACAELHKKKIACTVVRPSGLKVASQ